MTRGHGGLATLLDKEATSKVLRFCCANHQLDLYVKRATGTADGGKFDRVAHSFAAHLRLQQNQVVIMGSKFPKDATRWMTRGNMLTWLLSNRRGILEHIESRPEEALSVSWLIMMTGIQPFLVIV